MVPRENLTSGPQVIKPTEVRKELNEREIAAILLLRADDRGKEDLKNRNAQLTYVDCDDNHSLKLYFAQHSDCYVRSTRVEEEWKELDEQELPLSNFRYRYRYKHMQR